MKPVAESSKAADTERFEREVGVWKPPKKERAASLPPSPEKPTATSAYQPNPTKGTHISSRLAGEQPLTWSKL